MRYVKFITRDMLQREPETLFVFGDNMRRTGMGGQAGHMRGESNAVGIPTKHAGGMSEVDFFTDKDFAAVLPEIDRAFDRLFKHASRGGEVVWPEDGIGTGLAELPQRAPKIWQYLERERECLEAGSKRWRK